MVPTGTTDGRLGCPCRRDAGIADVVDTKPLWTYPVPLSSPAPARVAHDRYDLRVSDPSTVSARAVTGSGGASAGPALRVLVYSDDSDVRAQVTLALGKRPHPDLPAFEYVECATEPVVIQQMDTGDIDLAILDGEAVPAGGMGIALQVKEEIYRCPPVLVLTGRPQDAWLATWSRAEAVVPHPVDAIQLAEAVIGLVRGRCGTHKPARR